MRLAVRTSSNLHQAALISVLTLLGTLLACGSAADRPLAPLLPTVPALESVPFGLLGSGKVAFERIGPFANAYSAVYVVDAAAMSSAHIFDHTDTEGPALSPDGRRLAYKAFTALTGGYDVYVSNTDGTAVLHATHSPQQEGPPTWTPDGAKIVMAARTAATLFFDVYSQSPVTDPADLTQLTHFTAGPGGSLVCPTIYDDNDVRVATSAQSALAFACFTREIDVLSSNGAPSASYVPSRTDRRHWPNVFSPSWSADGSRLAFVETTSDSATNYGLVGLAVKMMNANGSNVTTVATAQMTGGSTLGGWAGLNNFSLCWMLDGSRLVFNVPESTLVGHLWVVRVDGTGLAQITSAPGVWDRSVSCSR
jgi:Tol biopolymer transport system component